jgi:ABC-type multidrug transport system ATPase subunit
MVPGGNRRLRYMMLPFVYQQELCKLFYSIKNKRKCEFSYGLLGPSGCGKTTLLRCIVGRLQLNRGDIIVLGERPGTRGHQVPGRAVGFMPQETALYKDFSISEMLHYFGHLHNMDRKDILSREEFLLSFLDLPSRSKKICQLRFSYRNLFI